MDANDEILQVLANCRTLIRKGQKQEADKILNSVSIDSHELSTDQLVLICGALLPLEMSGKALELLSDGLSREPDNWKIHSLMGIALALQGRYHQSFCNLSEANRLCPDHPKVLVNLSRVLVQIGRPEEAITHLKKLSAAVDAGGDSIQYLIRAIFAEALVCLGKPDEAEAMVETVQSPDKSNVRTYKLRALIAAGKGQHQEAVFYLKEALVLTPRNTQILKLLAEQASIQGYYLEAIQYLAQAVSIDPENFVVQLQLARAYLNAKDFALADKTAETALLLAEKEKDSSAMAQALSAKAAVASEKGCIEAATAYYQEAVAQDENCLTALLGFGNLQVQEGLMDEAVANFEKAAQINPLHGHSALVHVHRFPDDPDLLWAIEKSAKIPSMAGAVKIGLLFCLARSWDHHREYAKAFDFAFQANEATQKVLNYDRVTNRNQTERIIKFFSRDFFSGRKHYGNNSRQPVFILGMPRSGTTLTEQILSSHPDVFGAGELGHIPGWGCQLGMWEKMHGTGKEYPECIEDLTDSEIRRISCFCLKHLQSLSRGEDFVIDKLPHNFRNIGFIHLLFPRAPIIHCTRDPRDVAISNYFLDFKAKFGGMGYAYDLEDLGNHIADYQALMAHWETILPNRVFHVAYEDIVEDPEASSRRLIGHIGLDWFPELLNFQSLKRPVKTASSWQVRQPIYQSSKNKWCRYEKQIIPFIKALSHGRERWGLSEGLG
ncbi:sulfotransferase [uncultured Desulfobacter sp.]|uniref:tetratricopeptide repeat-containing sulfotransferase family protein n=1 Tax=uncultured Desulfobacter sp. TaxID=240139 RepID=UPI002AA8CD3F|nr:sulfotransferase [uncultured Desulfobacter sp.]